MNPSLRLAALLLFSIVAVGCGDQESFALCDNDYFCDRGEECQTCSDCCYVCSMDEGTPFDYIVSEILVPTDATELRTIGVDLDGNGSIDNKAANIAYFLWTYADGQTGQNEAIRAMIQDGSLIFLIRLVVDQFPTDPGIAVQLLYGDHDPTHDATEDNLTGEGSALVDPLADADQHLCAILEESQVRSGAGTVMVPYPLIDPQTGTPVRLPLQLARVRSTGHVQEGEILDLMVGGGLTPEDVDGLLPAHVAAINAEVIRDPTGPLWEFVRDSVDCQCDSYLPGCQYVIPGQDTCACWNGPTDPNPPITLDELLCNPLLETAFRPDIDIDGDLYPDLLSVGFKVSAIPITIVD